MLEKIYTADSVLRFPRRLIREMKDDIKASFEIAWRLLVRNIRARYRQTMLGYIWVFIPPVFTSLVWVFLKSQNIVGIQDSETPYAVLVFVGTFLWQVFVDALRAPLDMIESSKLMLTKTRFPRESLIIAGIGEVLFNFIVRLLILIVVFLWFRLELHATLLLLPLGIFSLVMLGVTLGMLLVPCGVLYRDVGYGMVVVTQIWFYLTPIVYPTPTSFPASLVAKLNPVSPLIITMRAWIIEGSTGGLATFAMLSIGICILMLAGWGVYRVAMPHILERVSA